MEPLLGSSDGVCRDLLLSHAITRLATQGWLFIAPLVLVRLTPGKLLGPAIWGLGTMLASTLLSPGLGAWADVSDRKRVVTYGVLVQAVAVLGSTAVLALALRENSEDNFIALLAYTGFSCLEKLGLALSDVAVKREWAPRLFEGEELKRTNGWLSQIDLLSETVGPFVAGLLITPSSLLPGEVVGFILVGLLNVLSFFPQLCLLRRIYDARSPQLQPLDPSKVQRKAMALAPKGGAWSAWCQHPSGIQFLSISYAVLYLTVLSPHGAFLTAHLAMRQVPSFQLSLLRGAGALVGVLGVVAHPRACQVLGGRTADALFVIWLALCTVAALVSFNLADGPGMTPALLVFVVSVVVSRPGLYGFELGVLNTEQELSDARHRSAIGAVDTALVSFATLFMYGSGILFGSPEQFGILVESSSCCVCTAAMTYVVWLVLYHSHRHRHVGAGDPGDGHEHGHAHGPEHGHQHGHDDHLHTLQQEEALGVDGWHEHIHYHGPSCVLQ